jgi:hypothetical protein
VRERWHSIQNAVLSWRSEIRDCCLLRDSACDSVSPELACNRSMQCCCVQLTSVCHSMCYPYLLLLAEGLCIRLRLACNGSMQCCVS